MVHSRCPDALRNISTEAHLFSSDTLAWYPSRDVFGRSREFARDKRSMAIMCSTDGTSYQAPGSAVSSASSSWFIHANCILSSNSVPSFTIPRMTGRYSSKACTRSADDDSRSSIAYHSKTLYLKSWNDTESTPNYTAELETESLYHISCIYFISYFKMLEHAATLQHTSSLLIIQYLFCIS